MKTRSAGKSHLQNRMAVSAVWYGRIFPWLLIAAVLAFLIADTGFRAEVLRGISSIQTNEAIPEETALVAGARIRSYILPPTAMDGRWWIIHTEALMRGESWRVRNTQLDNAQIGREVHWNNGIPWLLAGMASVAAGASTDAWQKVPEVSFWFAPLTLALAILGFLILSVRPFGWSPSLVFSAFFCLCPLIYSEFRAGQLDHHGLAAAFSAASILALLGAGAGNIRKPGVAGVASLRFLTEERVARKGFILSGILGGAALWVSAASYIPVLAGLGVGAILACLLRDQTHANSAPKLWRTWGVAGCVTSLGFYLMEYFPSNLGFRLEVNHPVYALAWLGAGDLLARINAWIVGESPFKSGLRSVVNTGLSLCAVVLPIILIAGFSERVFWVADRFLLLLHNEYIQEFKSFFVMFRESPSPAAVWDFFGIPAAVILGAGFLLITKRLAPAWLALYALLLPPALLTLALSVWQVRWSVISMSIWVLGIVLLTASYSTRSGVRSRAFEAAIVAVSIVLFLGLPVISLLAWSHREVIAKNVPKASIPAILARDISQRLVQSSPDRLPRILAAPTTSTDLTYFSGSETLGTLYWENLEGLKRAAHIFGLEAESDVKTAMGDSGITHVLVATWDDFGKAYVDLLRQAGLNATEPGRAFLEKLLSTDAPPDWLRPLYYPIPSGFGITEQIKLFAVVPDQSAFDAALYRGIYALDAGDPPAALRILEPLVKIAPTNVQLVRLVHSARRAAAQTPKPPVQTSHEIPID